MSETNTDRSRVPSLKLPPKKELACRLIAEGATQTQTAAHPQVSVTKQTMWKWVRQPEMRARIEELRTSLDEQAREIIAGGVVGAAEAVRAAAEGKLLDDPKMVGHRLKAALWILDYMKQKKLPATDTAHGTRASPAVAELTDKEQVQEWLAR